MSLDNTSLQSLSNINRFLQKFVNEPRYKYGLGRLRTLIIAGFGNIIDKVYEIELYITHLTKRILM